MPSSIQSAHSKNINISYYLVQNSLKQCKSSMCSVLYLTLKDKLVCTLYKIINVGAENASCKVSNHMPESSSQATECNSVAARGNGASNVASPSGSLVHTPFPIQKCYRLQAMPQPKEQNRFFSLAMLKVRTGKQSDSKAAKGA